MQHATSFSAYLEGFLTEKTSTTSFGIDFANGEERAVLNEDRNSCMRTRSITIDLSDEDFMKPKKELAAEALEMDGGISHVNFAHEAYVRPEVKPEDDLTYEDPPYEGPGPSYRCPLNNCSFKTNQEVLHICFQFVTISFRSTVIACCVPDSEAALCSFCIISSDPIYCCIWYLFTIIMQ